MTKVLKKEINKCLEILAWIKECLQNQLDNISKGNHPINDEELSNEDKHKFMEYYSEMLVIIDDVIKTVEAAKGKCDDYKELIGCLLYTYEKDKSNPYVLFGNTLFIFTINVEKKMVETFVGKMNHGI